MNHNEISSKKASESVDEQRTQWEGANYGMTVCRNGVVNVENRNYNEPGHIYSVRVEDGAATGCSCPHATYRGAHCKHQRAVEDHPLVVSSATAAGDTYAPVATDGGQPADSDEADDDRPDDCYCEYEIRYGDGERKVCLSCQRAGFETLNRADETDNEHHAGGTEENTITDDHGDRVPRRSERADFGGGESTGVQEL